jgi:ribosomal protein L32
MKLTHSKTGSRRAHHSMVAPRLVATKTGVRRRHFIDTDTGMYRGKQIITIGKVEAPKPVKAKVAKTEKKDAKKASKKEQSKENK